MRYPAAVWRGPADHNFRAGGVVRPAQGVVEHVIVGSLAAADSVFHREGYGASAHFGIGKDGAVVQWVDTADRAWAEGAGNPYWLSVETEGMPAEPLTNAQVAAFGALFRWCSDTHGPFPYVVCDSPSGRGLGTHSMGGQAWGGHACPGAIRAAQRPLILQAAAGAQPAPPQEEEMAHSWERVIYPGQVREIAIPPPEEGAFAGRPMFGSVGIDAMGQTYEARVVAGKPGALYAPWSGGERVPFSGFGRQLQWRFRKGDQCVSIINYAKPYDPDHPEKGPNFTFLFECA